MQLCFPAPGTVHGTSSTVQNYWFLSKFTHEKWKGDLKINLLKAFFTAGAKTLFAQLTRVAEIHPASHNQGSGEGLELRPELPFPDL